MSSSLFLCHMTRHAHKKCIILDYFHISADVNVTGDVQNQFSGHWRAEDKWANGTGGARASLSVGLGGLRGKNALHSKIKHLLATFHYVTVHELGGGSGIRRKVVGHSKWHLLMVVFEPLLKVLCSSFFKTPLVFTGENGGYLFQIRFSTRCTKCI